VVYFRWRRALMLLALVAMSAPCLVLAATDEQLPLRGPIAPYLMPRQAEIALARTGGPPSIAAHASVLVLTPRGFVTAVQGTNGWACIVERSFNSAFNDTEFWNPEERGPDCVNPPAVQSEIPQQILESQWAMAGLSAQQMGERTKAACADHRLNEPLPGAFGFMLSKEGHLNHAHGGPWRPHMMLFVVRDQTANWAPNLQNSPTYSSDRSFCLSSMVYIPVSKWSDGSPAPR
jgi:hypothetical protein